MNRGIPLLLVLLMTLVSLGPVSGLVGPSGQRDPEVLGPQDGTSTPEAIPSVANDPEDPMAAFKRGMDGTRPPLPLVPGAGPGDANHIPPFIRSDAVMLYEDPGDPGEWLPLPTNDDLRLGRAGPVTFANGTVLEVHGKLFERFHSEDITIFDDIGLSSVPIEVMFDGAVVPMHNVTGNSTSLIGPFWEFGNGTFEFNLYIEKPAGEYELVLEYDGDGMMIGVTHVTLINVNHPATIVVELSSSRVLPGEAVEVRGGMTDDTGMPVSNVPLQVWWEGRLLGPSAHGVYIDDVEVRGSNWSDDFEGSNGTWSTFSASDVDNQWERGTPRHLLGPVPHSMRNVWGTRLNSYYQRGAWSYLVSPVINMTEEEVYTLSFWAWWKLPWQDDFAYVVASTDYGETWDEEGAMTFTGSPLVSSRWLHIQRDVSAYSGSDHVRFAFVFFSPAKTTDTGVDGSFNYRHKVSNLSEVGRYDVSVAFPGDLHFQPSEETVWVSVVRNTRIELEVEMADRTGYRNKPIEIRGRLLDDRGEPLEVEIDGHQYMYYILTLWPWKGWPIDDDVGYPPFPRYPRVDPETGEFEITYVVDANHELGPVNVSLRFPGDDFYNGVQVTEVFQVKAHVHIVPPPPEDRTVHRGQELNILGELRIVPEESIDDKVLGDPVTGGFIKTWWGDQQVADRRTDFMGFYQARYLVPSSHPLGRTPVRYEYAGSDVYESANLTVDYTVVSDTFITLEDKVVTKGEWVFIEGTVRDDRMEPVQNAPVYIIWKRAPEIGRTTSKSDGRFSLQYYIEFEDRVGNITVIARFRGDGRYLEGEGRANYTVTARTILERRDRTFSIVRGEAIQITAKLYEDSGGYRGNEIQRELVTLSIDGVVVASKRTAFDGSVSFTVSLDPLAFDGGYVNLVMTFNGTEHYQASKNVTTVFIRTGQITTLNLQVNGRPFEPWHEVARLGDSVHGTVLVQNDTFDPWPGRKVAVHYRENRKASSERLIAEGVTDGDGHFEFTLVLEAREGGVVSLGVLSPGMAKALWYTLPYIVPPPPMRERIIGVEGDREVRVGSRLYLEVRVRNEAEWNMDGMTFTLVSPPEGVEISGDGAITWKPTRDQVGEHQVLVWLYDGDRSETATVVITVGEETTLLETALLVMAAMMAALLGLLAVAVVLSRRLRRRDGA